MLRKIIDVVDGNYRVTLSFPDRNFSIPNPRVFVAE